MISARRSLNLELQRWANLVPLLWEIDLYTIPLQQGVSVYSLPTETSAVLDVYLRTFSLTNTFNVTPAFSITSGSAVVTVTVNNHGLQGNYWINIVTPISVGNLLLSGYYQVGTVIDGNTFTITAPENASSTTSGGVVPEFTTTSGSTDITVTQANNGVVAGQQYNVGAETTVGGVTLYGAYTVQSVTDSSNFVISTYQVASSSASAYENDGELQMQGQSESVQPFDRIMTPMGRTDYAMIADKFSQAPPTTYWFDRQINPTMTIWQVPDGGGPYALSMYRMKRIQDANPSMGQTPDIPYRFYDALCACMARRLGMKYAKALLPALEKDEERALSEAQIEDRERAPIFITPQIEGYWN